MASGVLGFICRRQIQYSGLTRNTFTVFELNTINNFTNGDTATIADKTTAHTAHTHHIIGV